MVSKRSLTVWAHQRRSISSGWPLLLARKTFYQNSKGTSATFILGLRIIISSRILKPSGRSSFHFEGRAAYHEKSRSAGSETATQVSVGRAMRSPSVSRREKQRALPRQAPRLLILRSGGWRRPGPAPVAVAFSRISRMTSGGCCRSPSIHDHPLGPRAHSSLQQRLLPRPFSPLDGDARSPFTSNGKTGAFFANHIRCVYRCCHPRKK